MIRENRSEERRSKLTLLGLVEVVQDHAENDEESIATLQHLIASGRVRFEGVAEIVAGCPAISPANRAGVGRRDVDG